MGMGAGRRKRQVVLFVTAIVLPAAGLIGLAARIIGQDGSWPASEPPTNGETRIEQLRRELAACLSGPRLEMLKAAPSPTPSVVCGARATGG